MSTQPLDHVDQLTGLLKRWQTGDEQAYQQFIGHIYHTLKRLAGAQLASERHDPMIQPTLLVHEAFFKLSGAGDVDWQDRHHYLAVFTRAMRQVLVDLSRRRKARHQDRHRTITVNLPGTHRSPIDVIDMDRAMGELEQLSVPFAQVAQLRYFGGLTVPETAEAMQLSVATVNRHWRAARAFLITQLESAS